MIQYKQNTNKTGLTILREWTTPDFRNMPSTTNLEEEEIVDAPGNDGNASMPEEEEEEDDDDTLKSVKRQQHCGVFTSAQSCTICNHVW
jgi:hypothetical protein